MQRVKRETVTKVKAIKEKKGNFFFTETADYFIKATVDYFMEIFSWPFKSFFF